MSEMKRVLLDKRNELFAHLSIATIEDSYEPKVGMSLRRELLSLIRENGKVEERSRDAVSSAARRAKIEALLANTEKKKQALKENLNRNYTLLGELMFEQRKMNVLSEKIDFLEDDYRQYLRMQDEGAQGPLRRMLSRLDQSSFEKDGPRRYLNYARKLYEEGKEDLVTGERAEAIKREIETLSSRLDAQENAYSVLRGKLEGEGIPLEEGVNSTSSDLKKFLIGYGNYLFENGQKWIDENTPDDILDLISALLENERALDAEERRIRAEEGRAKAKEIDALIKENRMRIGALEAELERLEGKISTLRHEIMELEKEKESYTIDN